MGRFYLNTQISVFSLKSRRKAVVIFSSLMTIGTGRTQQLADHVLCGPHCSLCNLRPSSRLLIEITSEMQNLRLYPYTTDSESAFEQNSQRICLPFRDQEAPSWFFHPSPACLSSSPPWSGLETADSPTLGQIHSWTRGQPSSALLNTTMQLKR